MTQPITKKLEWSEKKNQWLIENRGVSFEDMHKAIKQGCLIKSIDHTNQNRYAGQKILLINYHNYIYAVPSVESPQKLFLKTIYPSRKYTKKYLKPKI